MGVDNWDSLTFWRTGEWQVIEEKLDEFDRRGILFNPRRELIFSSLDSTPIDTVKVGIFGQDPYPDREYATGLAFSIPASCQRIPASLSVIYDEYTKDLHLDRPKNGDLSLWTERGVLLWNVIPTCRTGQSMSHDWDEWSYLTKEIIVELARRDIVFIFIGSVARRYSSLVYSNKVIEVSHPSPRASKMAKNPFLGSRIFSRANALLVELDKEIVDWTLR